MRIHNKQYTTIWLTADDELQIIDQTKLPAEFKIVTLKTNEDVCTAISSMQVRGAGLIGVTAGYGVYLFAKNFPGQKDWQEYMQEECDKLLKTRPTAKNLSYALERQAKIWKNFSFNDALPKLRTEALNLANEDIDFCKRIGEHGKKLIEEIAQKKNGQPVNILTHCNAGWLAFTDYGSALSPVYTAFNAGIPVHVYVDETRPRNQGASLTAFELSEHNVPHTLIADNVGGHLMQHKMVDMVIVGADRVTRNGDAANKIGTYLKALAAHADNIPFYVALPSSTFDFSLFDGIKEIEIEERNSRETEYITGYYYDEKGQKQVQEVRICPEKTKGLNFAFDVTPHTLITGLITERGIAEANEKAILTLYPEAKQYIQ